VTDSREERLKRLQGRFKTHASGRPTASSPTRTRDRQSLYLDRELIARVNQTYLDVNHELYPRGGLTKSAFLEALIEYSLEHLSEVKRSLHDETEVRAE
jgi:hypothetical protein